MIDLTRILALPALLAGALGLSGCLRGPPPGREIFAIVRAYCPCRICCGKHANGLTATGADAYQPGVAVPLDVEYEPRFRVVGPGPIPLGSRVYVPGYGTAQADCTGGKLNRIWHQDKQLHIEVRFRLHADALKWGVQRMTVIWWPERSRIADCGLRKEKK